MASLPIRLAIGGTVGLLLVAAVYLWIVRGPAILLDLAASAANLLCL